MGRGGASGSVTMKRLGPGGAAQRRLERLRKRLRDLAKVRALRNGSYGHKLPPPTLLDPS